MQKKSDWQKIEFILNHRVSSLRFHSDFTPGCSDEKSYLIDKEMVIYSTLIEAATEHVEIFGKAGSTTIREIKIENPQDSTIVLFIEKVIEHLVRLQV